jgi:hypothetical protein
MLKPLSLTQYLRDWEQSMDSTGIINMLVNKTTFKGTKGLGDRTQLT